MLKRRLEEILGKSIINTSGLGGGCIANAQKVETADGGCYLLKSGGLYGMFPKEANGLKEIAKSRTIAVPDVIAADDDFLLLSYIQSGPISPDFFRDFAFSYAQMHRYTNGQYGFYENNYIGETKQLNIPSDKEANDWTRFFFNKRLLYQFKLAESNDYVKQEMRQAFSKIEDNIDLIIGTSKEAPSLLHGDLWGGNYIAAQGGKVVLIDPAVYYGHREADLAMTKVFGGFPPAFYQYYNEAFPLLDGWEYRENIYRLYHILNHLNLFGSSYYSEALQLMRFYD